MKCRFWRTIFPNKGSFGAAAADNICVPASLLAIPQSHLSRSFLFIWK
jgi:hypothetical protein